MSKEKTVIKVRRGANGFRYSACDEHGYFIGNFKKLGDVRKHWLREIQRGQVELVRELDQAPDMSKLDAAIKAVDAYLRALTKKKK
jgi:hypothetical protein